jgi:multidrug efflux pump subunit AcrB
MARVRFKRGMDPQLAVMLVQNRAALAQPILPDAVQKAGMAVKLEAGEEGESKRVSIAIEDRQDRGRQALRAVSEAVLKRLTAEKAIVEGNAFPDSDEKSPAVFRVDMYPAVRITGLPPEGETAAAAAAKCAALANAELATQKDSGGVTVVNLNAR